MKEKIIELFEMFGYDFIEERPDTRLLFYQESYEETVQLWIDENKENNLKRAVDLISQRIADRYYSAGQSQLKSEFKQLLGL